MVGIVFGNNYTYGGKRATGDAYRYAATNLAALTRSSTAGLLDQALADLDTIRSLSNAKKSIYGTTALVDVFV